MRRLGGGAPRSTRAPLPSPPPLPFGFSLLHTRTHARTHTHTHNPHCHRSNVKALVEKARAGKLAPEEYQGGTFTISNLGSFGVRQFAAIVNTPQAGILAVGAAEKRVVADGAAPGGWRTSTMMNVTLSADHRVVDGAVGATWLGALKGCLENPLQLLL